MLNINIKTYYSVRYRKNISTCMKITNCTKFAFSVPFLILILKKRGDCSKAQIV